MDARRIDEIEIFLETFKGPASARSEHFQQECLNEAAAIIGETAKITVDEASDFYPRLVLLLWLAEEIDLKSGTGGSETAQLYPAPRPKIAGPRLVEFAASDIHEQVFGRLSHRYPFLQQELETRLEYLVSTKQ